ncbi:hypothetical protein METBISCDRAFT_22859 [Metschnikowia bicuspidata]|uniref:Uncharacterized protein n=1 Tax=Metschnikowia bicuspidata TaxID=27322 RepID=A0A4P9ZDF1_9ASCO|nr:hypothetical protein METBISCDRAFT_22859 [Metschnikowia bicuspidata]
MKYENNCRTMVQTYFGRYPESGKFTIGGNASHIPSTKDKDALAKQLGAAHFAATDDEEFVKKVADTVDVFVNTGNSFKGASFDKGQLYFITVQPVGKNLELVPSVVVVKNTSVHGSAIGSPEELEYMLELTSKHIKPWVDAVVISENLGKTWKRSAAEKP